MGGKDVSYNVVNYCGGDDSDSSGHFSSRIFVVLRNCAEIDRVCGIGYGYGQLVAKVEGF